MLTIQDEKGRATEKRNHHNRRNSVNGNLIKRNQPADQKALEKRNYADSSSEGHDLRPVILFILIISILNIFFGFKLWAAEKTINAQISLIGDATHLEFPGVRQWEYSLKTVDAKTVEIELPALNVKSRGDFLTWSSEQVESISIDDGLADGKVRLRLKLKDNGVQSFDYLTDDPTRLIVDFFRDPDVNKESPKIPATAATAVEKKSDATVAPAYKEIKKDAKAAQTEDKWEKEKFSEYKSAKKSERKPASETPLLVSPGFDPKTAEPDKHDPTQIGLFDAGDTTYERFRIKDYEIKEESIIASRENIYVRFPRLKLPLSQLEEMRMSPPDYGVNLKDTKESKEAQFLVTLFKNKRWASFLKVQTYFLQQYPQTEYRELVEYMAADVQYELWLRDKQRNDLAKAVALYEKLVRKFPDSPLTARTRKMLNYISLEEGNGIEIVQQFQKYINDNPDPEEVDQAKLVMAEGHQILRQYDAALEVYGDVEKTAKSELKRVEAQYRIGDVYMRKLEYAEAVKAYQAAAKKYPKFVKVFPNLAYNLAESYFWLGEYKNAIEQYRQYLIDFPKHDHNSFALTRVGELLEILGADSSRVMGAFMESYFRYAKSQGAEVARVRMLSQQMKGMKEKELSKAQDELLKIAKDSTLPKMEEFVTLMISSGFHRRGEFEKSLDYLVTYYQRYPMSTNLAFFKKRIVGNISDVIDAKIDEDKFMAALDVYHKYKNTWLRNVDRIDIPYFVGSAYEKAGVLAEANRIYERVLSRLEKIQGTREGLERKVQEHLPTVETLHLRKAAVALERREYSEAYNHLAAIKSIDHLAPAEQVERVELGARIYEEKNQPKEAVAYLHNLSDKWSGQKDLLGPVHLKLAELEVAIEKPNDAEVSADKAIEIYQTQLEDKTKNKTAVDRLVRSMRAKGLALENQKKDVAAVEVYTQLLEKFPDHSESEGVRYRMGEILFKKSDIKGAAKVWATLKSGKGDVYGHLADQKLKQANWETDYKKYIQRIPAMSEMR